MAKGLPRSLSRGRQQLQEVVRLSIPVDTTIDIADGAPGFGTGVIGGLPEGNILLLGATLNATFTKGDADIIDAFDGDVSLGTAPTADNSLSGAEVDIIPSTALGPATSGAVSQRLQSTATENGTFLDNTDGTAELNLNVLIDDASISGASTMAVVGQLEVAAIVLGV